MLRLLLRLSVGFPRHVLAVVLAITLMMAWGIPGIQLRLDGRSLIPQNHPSMRAADEAAAIFGLRDLVVVALHSDHKTIYTGEGLQLLSRLSDEIAHIDGIDPLSVTSLATMPRLSIAGDVLDLRPLLGSGRAPDTRLAQLLRRETEALEWNQGVLVSHDGATAAVYAAVEADADPSVIRRGVEELAARNGRGAFRIAFSGSPIAQAELGEAAATDLARLVPAVLAIIGLIITVTFGHPLPALICLLEICLSLIWTAGLMGFRREEIFVTTLALPVILMVVGISDDLYLLKRYYRTARTAAGRPAAEVTIEAVEPLCRPLLLTGLTTMLGLLSLVTMNLEPQRVFGLYGAVSVAVSTVFTFTLVPALLTLAGRRLRDQASRRAVDERSEAVLRRWFRTVRPASVLGALIAFGGAIAMLAPLPRIEDNWIGNLAEGSELVAGDLAINRWLAGTNTLEIAFDSGHANGFLEPRTLAALGAVEEALRAHASVGAVHSAYSEVVRVSAALAGVTVDAYRSTLERGGAGLSAVEISQALVLLGSLGRSPLVHWTDDEYRRARMTIFVRSANYSRVDEILRVVGAVDRRVSQLPAVPFGDGWTGHVTIGLLVRGQIASIAVATVANTVVLTALFGSLTAALVAMAPVVAGTLLVFAGLGAAGMPLGTANSMFAAIALGVGADYSIHLTSACRQRIRGDGDVRRAVGEALAGTGPAILTSAIALPAGFLVLLLSAVPPNRELGLLVAVGMVTCAAMALLLVPTLMLLVERGKPRSDAGEPTQA